MNTKHESRKVEVHDLLFRSFVFRDFVFLFLALDDGESAIYLSERVSAGA
jgi:hypothetical protein